MRCIIEDSRSDGVVVFSGEMKLVDCVVRNNGQHGLLVYGEKVTLIGGTISGNGGRGVLARRNAGVTVAVAEVARLGAAEVDRPQTVSKENGRGRSMCSGGIGPLGTGA